MVNRKLNSKDRIRIMGGREISAQASCKHAVAREAVQRS